ncbi:hypothetical protein FHU30_006398 [Actinomadura rupiterrae]|nr:hypothetical protein [Actinomadura rupiterrae]
MCPHGVTLACFARHETGDLRLGQPLCPDCYDYPAHAVWNNASGELWRRTKQAIERHLNRTARQRGLPRVRVSHGKAAEYQARGALHFHVLLRLDGIDPDDPAAIVAPPAGLTVVDLQGAIQAARDHIGFTTPPHPRNPRGWLIRWGDRKGQDAQPVRVVTLTGGDTVTDAMVASYLAKYATKGTEITGHSSRRLHDHTIRLYADPNGTHTERLIAACWDLGHPDHTTADADWSGLRRWAHMLGFGGHFLTKARHYSITFRALREARVIYRRTETHGPEYDDLREREQRDTPTTLIVGTLTYAGTGWRTTGDALLANTAADQARKRAEIGREELAFTPSDSPQLNVA